MSEGQETPPPAPPPPPSSPGKNHPKMKDFDDDRFHASTGGGICRIVLHGILAFLLLAGIVALILFLLYRPEKPQFVVKAAAVYDLNITSVVSPPLVSASMQFTLLTRNPNVRTGVYYDRLTAYVAYKDQPLTKAVVMPPLTLDKHEAVLMSPVMGGGVPVHATEEAVNGLEMDEGFGMVQLSVVVTGRLRWKAGVFWSMRRRLSVRCDVVMGLRKGLVGHVPLLASSPCRVDA